MPNPDLRHIAIVAVHGVAYHAPNSSARAIANMLINTDRSAQALSNGGTPDDSDDRRARYTPFQEVPLDIAVHHLRYEERGGEVKAARSSQRPKFDIRGPRVSERLAGQQTNRSFDHDFMCDLLDGYVVKGDDAVYSTVRFEGHRLLPNGNPQASIHVYEMYWNDLSRVGSGIAGFFSTLYLLLFHVGDLGTLTIDMARDANATFPAVGQRWAWSCFAWLQMAAVTVLTILVPLLNLLLLLVGLGILPCSLVDVARDVAPVAVCVLPVLIVGCGCAYVVWRYYPRPDNADNRGQRAYVAFSIAGVISAGCWFGMQALVPQPDSTCALWLGAEWALLAGLAYWQIVRKYSDYRPGSGLIGAVLGLVCFVGLWACVSITKTDSADGQAQFIASVLFEAVRWLYLAMEVSWAAFVLLSIVALLMSLVALRLSSVPEPVALRMTAEERTKIEDRAKQIKRRNERCVWTSVVSLTIPALLFLAVTFALWSGIVGATSGVWERYNANPPPATTHFWNASSPMNHDEPAAHGFLFPIAEALHLAKLDADKVFSAARSDISKQTLIGGQLFLRYLCQCTVPWLKLQGMLVAAALLIVAWAFAPSVLTEAIPPRRNHDLAPDQDTTSTKSKPLGQWLTDGYLLMGMSGTLFLAVVLLQPLSYVWPCSASSACGNSGMSNKVVEHAAVPVAITTILAALGALLTQLKGATSKFGSLVGVALDVDNHLRRLPKGRTPRARMCARYSSLLRYLSRWRDPEEPEARYDAIVIVAHSQGTVLTADLLRFLKAEKTQAERNDSQWVEFALAKLPDIALFTMGCPLRQLYGLRFPYLYEWTRDGTGNLPGGVCDPMELLKVIVWLNAYRSGDYVGRQLWMDDKDQRVYSYEQKAHRDGWNRGEFCIGAGAHTHYWDDTAPEIAVALDGLIDKCGKLSKAAIYNQP